MLLALGLGGEREACSTGPGIDVEVEPGKPLRFLEESHGAAKIVQETESQSHAHKVAATIKAYCVAAKELLTGKYQDADIRKYAPAHLRDPSNALVLNCSDGILIRYDAADAAQPIVRSAEIDATLAQLVPQFSDSLIHVPPDPASYDPGPGVIEFQLLKFDATGKEEPIGSMRPLIYVRSQPDARVPLPPPHRPIPLISITNEEEIIFTGVVVPGKSEPAPQAIEKSHEFVARSHSTPLNVGWRAIELFPKLDPRYWNPEYAPLWAENDLLATVVRNRLRDAQFTSLDPNLGARRTFARLIAELEHLLDGPEEPAHQFLKANPSLISPTHSVCWSKLPFGNQFSDFVFREPWGDYVLVEIESPVRQLFRKDGQPRQELTHAWDQILDWRRYLENNLDTVRTDLGLTGISANPKSLIVIGRSSTVSDENRLKLMTLQNQVANLRILTYDDLINSAKSVAENLFGPLNIVTSNADIYFVSKSRSE